MSGRESANARALATSPEAVLPTRQQPVENGAVGFPTLLCRGPSAPQGFPPALKASPREPMKVALPGSTSSLGFNLTLGVNYASVDQPLLPKASSQRLPAQMDMIPRAGQVPDMKGLAQEVRAYAMASAAEQVAVPLPEPSRSDSPPSARLAMRRDGDADHQVQDMLAQGLPVELDFAKIAAMAAPLAVDAEGHRLVELGLEKGTTAQQVAIARSLQGNIIRLSTDVNGCWVVQKAIDVLPRSLQLELFQELSNGVEACIESKHGNFVIQACIEQLPPDSAGFVVAAIEQNAKHMACHKYGCRVVQRLLEHCPLMQVRSILDQVVDATVELSRHQYGCHVMRCVLERGNPQDRRKVFGAMCSDVVRLSRNRLSSLVLEKCVEVASRYEAASECSEEEALLHRDLRALVCALLQDELAVDEVPGETALAAMAGTRAGRCFLRRLCDCAPLPEQTALEAVVSATIRRRG
eukprot:TRINITY_DN8218_c0_g1_i1.p1 TRINITY_DN8218_c0_g1~~TRINITY_DN8218_c0_g1_i1.p1  ORF type:complete len:467 (+),score=85.52 TRINITY_DN8218_c0_g1_i1:88-1488(+)